MNTASTAFRADACRAIATPTRERFGGGARVSCVRVGGRTLGRPPPLLWILLLLQGWSAVVAADVGPGARVVGGPRPTRTHKTRAPHAVSAEVSARAQKDVRYYWDDEPRDSERDVKFAPDGTGAPQKTALDSNGRQETNCYDESVNGDSADSIPTLCYLPLVFMSLIWIGGPLLCLIFQPDENRNELNEIILKSSHCRCGAKYTNR